MFIYERGAISRLQAGTLRSPAGGFRCKNVSESVLKSSPCVPSISIAIIFGSTHHGGSILAAMGTKHVDFAREGYQKSLFSLFPFLTSSKLDVVSI